MTTDDFFAKENYSCEDIESLITGEAEESINLDFKRSDSLQKNPSKKKEISKDVSAFANSEGGIIVYGIDEVEHVANSKSFVNGEEITKEWIEQVINANIHQRIQGLGIYPIRYDNDIERTIYIVKIPQSQHAPHMANDYRFYKRLNFESVPMEQYEVRFLYNKTYRTTLAIKDFEYIKTASIGKPGNYKSVSYVIFFSISNIGAVLENNYKLKLTFNSKLLDTKNQGSLVIDSTNGDVCTISYTEDNPIYPSEKLTSFGLPVVIHKSLFDDDNALIIQSELFYSHGKDVSEFNLKDKLTIVEVSLEESLFF